MSIYFFGEVVLGLVEVAVEDGGEVVVGMAFGVGLDGVIGGFGADVEADVLIIAAATEADVD